MEEVSGAAGGRVSSRPPSQLNGRVYSRPPSEPSGRDSPRPPSQAGGASAAHPPQRPASRQPSRRRPPQTPICDGCEKPFKFEASPIKGAPAKDRRLPFLLDCGHTRCEECAKGGFRPGKGVICLKCAYVTPLRVNPGDNLNICIEQLPLDYYAFGILSDEILTPKRYSTFNVREEIEKSLKQPVRCDPDDRDDVARKFGVPLPQKDDAAVERTASSASASAQGEAAEPESDQKCEECLESSATVKCRSCQLFFCRSCCDRLHSVSRLFSQHEMEALSSSTRPVILSVGSSAQNGNGDVPLMCKVHRKKIDYFCKPDQSFLCSTCVQYDHKDHSPTSLAEFASRMQATLAPALDRCKRSVNLLTSTEKELDERVIKDIQAGADATAAFVYKHFAGLHARLQRRQFEIIKQIVSMSLEEILPILQLKELLKEKVCEIQEVVSECRQVMNNPISDSRPMVSKIEATLDFPVVLDHLPTTDRCIQFCGPKDEQLEKMMYKYGNLVNPNTSTPDGSRFQLIKAEDAPGDVMLNILENSGTSVESEEANSSAATRLRPRTFSAKSDASSHASNHSLQHQPKDRSQLLQGETCKVIISYIDNPSRFFVQRADETHEAQKLVRRLTDWCQEPRNMRPMTANNLSNGYLYAAKWKMDELFYRARVERVLSDYSEPLPDEPEGAKVQWAEALFIDYGNVELIPVPWFCELPPKFKAFPGKCHVCALYDISPPKRAASFSLDATDKFHSMVRDRELQMSVRGKSDGVWQVDLHQAQYPKLDLDSPLSVRDALVFLDFAVFTSNLSAPESVVPIHDKRKYLKAEVPPLKLPVDTCIVHAQSPKEFFVHLNPKRHWSDLRDMSLRLQRVYNQDEKDFLTLFCPQPGMVCAAKFSSDKIWYRAVVVEIIGKRTVEVEFVDYGNRERTSIWNVKKLTDEFLVMTAQAVKCALSCALACDYDEAALKRGKLALERISSELMTDEREIFVGRLIQPPAKSGEPHVIQLETTRVKAVDEAVKSAMEGSEGLERFIVDPPTPAERPEEDRESPPPRASQASPAKTKPPRRSKKEKSSDDPSLPTGVKTVSKEQKQSISVSHALTPDQFYIQVTRAKEDLNLLEKRLTKECESSSSDPLEDVAVGSSCAALVKFQEFEGFQKWCRITVIEKLPKNKIRARLIDTGREKVLRMSDLRKFPSPDLLKTPAFALEGHLLNIVPTGGSTAWSQVACEYFTDLVKRNETCFTEFHKTSGNRFGMQLFVKTVEEETALEPAKVAYEDVAELLIDHGFALRPRKTPNGLASRMNGSSNAANVEVSLPMKVVVSTAAPTPVPASQTALASTASSRANSGSLPAAAPAVSDPAPMLAPAASALPDPGNGSCISNDSTVVASSVTILERNLQSSPPNHQGSSRNLQSSTLNLQSSPPTRLAADGKPPVSAANSGLLKPDFFDSNRATPNAEIVASAPHSSVLPASTIPATTSAITIPFHDNSLIMPSLEVASSRECSLPPSPSQCRRKKGLSPSRTGDSTVVGVAMPIEAEAAETPAGAEAAAEPEVMARDRSHEFPRWKHFDVEKLKKILPDEGKTFCFTSFVTFVDNRGVIWATPSNIYDDNSIHVMTQDSQKFYKDLDPIDLAGELQTGQAVMAQYLKEDDDKWYRARVDKVVQVGGVSKVDVIFIEFGNTERVFPHQIRTVIKPDLLEKPQFNVEMNLCHIRPVNVAKGYTNNDVTMIHDLLVGHSVLSRVVPNIDGTLGVDSEGILPIDFCQPLTETSEFDEAGALMGDMEAARVLLAIKRAELVPERQTPFSPQPPSINTSMLCQASRSSSETSTLGCNLGRDDCGDDNEGDDGRVLEESLKALKLKPAEDVVPAGFAKEVLKHRFMRMTAPEIDFPYRVLAWNEESFHYHYDIEHPRFSQDPVLVDKKRECEESIKYEREMQTEAVNWPVMNFPQVDLPAAARWHSDGRWYRAQILNVPDYRFQGAKVMVHFVDWGNVDKVLWSDLRYIPLEGLRPRRRSTRGKIWRMNTLTPIILHPQREKLSDLLSLTSFHGVMKNIEKLPSGDLRVELTMSVEGSDDFALKDFVRTDELEPKSEDFA